MVFGGIVGIILGGLTVALAIVGIIGAWILRKDLLFVVCYLSFPFSQPFPPLPTPSQILFPDITLRTKYSHPSL